MYSAYLRKFMEVDDRAERIEIIVDTLSQFDHEFDAIACTGVSGLIVASVLAYRMEKHLIILRKDGENSHAAYCVENNRKQFRVLIVDDLVSSGNTLRRIDSAVSGTIVGALLYHTGELLSDESLESWLNRPVTTFNGYAINIPDIS